MYEQASRNFNGRRRRGAVVGSSKWLAQNRDRVLADNPRDPLVLKDRRLKRDLDREAKAALRSINTKPRLVKRADLPSTVRTSGTASAAHRPAAGNASQPDHQQPALPQKVAH